MWADFDGVELLCRAGIGEPRLTLGAAFGEKERRLGGGELCIEMDEERDNDASVDADSSAVEFATVSTENSI